jgi:citrate lyase beta subunit
LPESLEAPTRRRGLRTLDLFLEALLAHTAVPPGFRVTVPKVTSVQQVEAMVEICAALESAYGIFRLRFELQIETPQAVLGADGTALLARMIHTAAGRCVGLHYGTYDYSASLGIAAAYQSMEHPAADHAKAVMQVAAADTGVGICDGSTNVLPVGAGVRAAWELHARLVRRSLERGFYQGWDLHPAQLPTRFAATFAFYRDGLAAAGARLRSYRERSSSGVLDEPATARALAGYLLRALDAGAVDAAEVSEAAGVDAAELGTLAGRVPR